MYKLSDINKPNLLIIIGGPTASGKTELAIKLSQDFDIEIINADSRQIYKYFNIGTNKGKFFHLDNFEMIDNKKIPEVVIDDFSPAWLFDFVEPNEDFSLNTYQILATNLIKKIQYRNKIPVLVGGTGLYIDAIINNYKLNTPPNIKLRQNLEKLNISELQQVLRNYKFDLNLLNNSDKNNKVRLIRLIEKAEQKITPKSENKISNYSTIFLYPDYERDKLMNKINQRVLNMIKEGLIEETREMINKGFQDTRPMYGIGYKEILDHINGKYDIDTCITEIQQSHRNYAKRQITWFEGKGRNYDLIKVTQNNIPSTLKEKLKMVKTFK